MINKNHPDYPELEAEFNALIAEWRAEKEALPKFSGLDGPSIDVDRKYDQKQKELMSRYPQVYKEED